MSDDTMEPPFAAAVSDVSPKTVEVADFLAKDPDNDRNRVRLVDTPGFNSPKPNVEDFDHIKRIVEWLEKEPKSRVHGILYLHEITQTREIDRSTVRPEDVPRPPGIFVVTTKWAAESNEGLRAEQEKREADLQENLGFSKASMRRFEEMTAHSAWKIIKDVRSSPVVVTRHALAKELKKLANPGSGNVFDMFSQMVGKATRLFKVHRRE